jgi:phosphoglycolate phosphatase (TIGR01487 family)
MSGFLRAVALDLDGTLTGDGRVSEPALRAVADWREQGMAALLVTGRILEELEREYPGLSHGFDAVVLENGAVLASAAGLRDLARPVERELVQSLAAAGVRVRRGRVLLACDARDAVATLEAIERLGLDCQLVHNRGALMVLPAGVSKGTGLTAALEELGISAHNVIAVGDAENDLALLEVAEIGVAVANAVPSLRRHADVVLEREDGRGVAELLAGPIGSGERAVHPARRRVVIGRFEDGSAATVPGANANLLVCGDSGSGKSYVAGLLVERWVTAGYSVLVVDMEGDHIALDRLRNTVVLENRPSAPELLSVLRQRSLSVVLDVSGIADAERLSYLQTLPPLIEAERAAWGLPHWIVIDEAHETLGADGIAARVFRPSDRGYCLVTFRPDVLCAEALAAIDVTITVAAPYGGGAAAVPTAVLRETGGPERVFEVAARRVPHVRHRHKYAARALPAGHWFHFRTPDGAVIATARDLRTFARQLGEVDPAVVSHHLEHGDFSRWLLAALQDRELGAAAGALEREALARRAAHALDARTRLQRQIESRYLHPGDDAEPDDAAP